MEKKKINMDLRFRIKEYLRFIWQEENTQFKEEENIIINNLSQNLKEEILLESYGKILMNNSLFFINFSKKSLKEVIAQKVFKEVMYTPGEFIFKVLKKLF